MRLHIGGKVRKDGWTLFNITPGPDVDIVGSCTDLGMIAGGTCTTVYASHVLEHLGYDDDLPKALKEIFRVLAPGGEAMIAVPDLYALSALIITPELTTDDRWQVMRMIFGGRVDAHDVHLSGLTVDMLAGYLNWAGFVDLRRVEAFGLFDDMSTVRFAQVPVSLNMIARKPAA